MDFKAHTTFTVYMNTVSGNKIPCKKSVVCYCMM